MNDELFPNQVRINQGDNVLASGNMVNGGDNISTPFDSDRGTQLTVNIITNPANIANSDNPSGTVGGLSGV